MFLAMFSVPCAGKHLGALVPVKKFFGAPIQGRSRLVADDPIWEDSNVKFHWVYAPNPSKSRLRPRDTIKFFWCSPVAV